MGDQLALDFDNGHSRLTVAFSPDDHGTLESLVGIEQWPLKLTSRFWSCGYDLAEFARDLEALHAQYDGTARFRNLEESCSLECSILYPACGVVAITVAIEHTTRWPDDLPNGKTERRPKLLCFDGFTTNQSYLPGLVGEIRTTLDEWGISTTHPLLR